MMGLLQLLFGRSETVEKRSMGTGFTAELIGARHAYIAGRSGLGELTATVQTCVGLWESGFALAKVDGAPQLTRRHMALIARALALRGEAVLVIDGDALVPCSDWDMSTRGGRPRAYRVSVPEVDGGSSRTVLAREVLHIVTGSDPAAPWSGSAPLRRASLSAGLLQAVEDALSETFALAPLGSSIVPMPEMGATDNDALGRSFRGQRGRVLLRESVAVSAAGGPVPAQDWRPSSLSPNIRDAMAVEVLDRARDAILGVFGALPALANPATTGPMVREAQRHLATWTLQPLAELLAEEASAKLGVPVSIDVLTPLQAFDAGGHARAVATIIGAMVEAKAGGLSAAEISAAFGALDWAELKP